MSEAHARAQIRKAEFYLREAERETKALTLAAEKPTDREAVIIDAMDKIVAAVRAVIEGGGQG